MMTSSYDDIDKICHIAESVASLLIGRFVDLQDVSSLFLQASHPFRIAVAVSNDELSRQGIGPIGFRENIYANKMSAYLVFFLAWLRIHKVDVDMRAVTRAALIGTVGYRVLDEFFDGDFVTPADLHSALSLISIHESLLLQIFGKDMADIIFDARMLYDRVQSMEFRHQWRRTPYSFDSGSLCGQKFAMLFPPFAMALARIGRKCQIRDYEQMFLALASVMQILDDLSDLEIDLARGFSTMPTSGLELSGRPEIQARAIRSNFQQMEMLAKVLNDLLGPAEKIAEKYSDLPARFAVQVAKGVVENSALSKGISLD